MAKIHIEECTECGRTETAMWYRKTTPNPICCSCYRKEYVANNREKALESQRKANQSEKSKKTREEYGKSDKWKARRRQLEKEQYWKDPEAVRTKKAKYKDPDYSKKHYQANKPVYHEKSMRRKRNMESASLGNKYKDKAIEVYATCPTGYEVDHIVPLKGYGFLDGIRQQVVSGLHVYWNLQHLPKSANRAKSCNFYNQEASCQFIME